MGEVSLTNFCGNCGAKTDGAAFCRECGQPASQSGQGLDREIEQRVLAARHPKVGEVSRGFEVRRRPHLLVAAIAGVMLVIALAPLPYGYYQFLRWAVCAIAIFIAIKAYTWRSFWATWLFGAIAVLFNPIVPVNLPKATWQPIDAAVALLFWLSIFLVQEPRR